jgi:hypothetical protein
MIVNIAFRTELAPSKCLFLTPHPTIYLCTSSDPFGTGSEEKLQSDVL